MLTTTLALLSSAALAAALPHPFATSAACPAPNGAMIQVDSHNYQVRCDTEYPGNNIGGYTIQGTFATCVARCGETPGCIAAQYSIVDKHCETKGGIGGARSKAGSHAFVRVDLGTTTKWIAESTASGDDGSTIERRQTTGHECGWLDWGLKNDLPQNPSDWTLHCNSTLSGGVLLYAEGQDYIVLYFFYHCASECLNRGPQCAAFSWEPSSKECRMYTGKGVVVPATIDGTIAVVKKEGVFPPSEASGPTPEPAYKAEDVSTFGLAIKPILSLNGLSSRLASEPEKRGVDRRKRGVTYNDPDRIHALRGVPDSKIAWSWNWYSSLYGQNCNNNAFPGANSMEGMTFIPNIWTAQDQCLSAVWEANVNDAIARYKTDSLIAFNELEIGSNAGGSALSVGEAVEGYRRLMHPFRGRVSLGAPATTFTGGGADGGWGWIKDFMSACHDCHIDFIPVHYFVSSWGDPGAAVTQFQAELGWLAENLNRPIWITEMAYSAPEEEEIWFLRAMIDFFEANDWVSRYSYRTAEEMVRPDGGVTRVGECYACFRTGSEGDSCCL